MQDYRALDQDVYAPGTGHVGLRKRIGMVSQRPDPLPLSIYESIAFAAHVHRTARGSELDDSVEACLKSVLLWDELKGKLSKPVLGLTLKLPQRLCIARLLTVVPDILLTDEPCLALYRLGPDLRLDAVRVFRVRQGLGVLDGQRADEVVAQVPRRETPEVFTNPEDRRTRNYVAGRYGWPEQVVVGPYVKTT